MSDGDLTRTERYYQRVQAKRYRAQILKQGICSACMHREVTLGIYHCRNKPDRQGGCHSDGKSPVFQLDDEVTRRLADAA